MIIANIIMLSIMIVGCLNWFLVGVFSWNLVTAIFGLGVFSRIIYAIVGLAGTWMLIMLIVRRSRLFSKDDLNNKKQ